MRIFEPNDENSIVHCTLLFFRFLSEEKAQLLRRIGDEIEESDSSYFVFISGMGVEDIPGHGEHTGEALRNEYVYWRAILPNKFGAVCSMRGAYQVILVQEKTIKKA